MIRYTDLFQDRVVRAVNAQFPDLMVVCHDEKRLFSWNDKHFRHILVIKCKFWNLGSESDCEHQADRTKPCTYWDCVPVLHSHPHIGTCRSHRCWCIAGCRGEWWSTHRCPRKSCHHPSGRNQASIYTDKNKQICGAICQCDSNEYLTSTINDDQSVNLDPSGTKFYSTSVTRTHIKYLRLLVSAFLRPLQILFLSNVSTLRTFLLIFLFRLQMDELRGLHWCALCPALPLTWHKGGFLCFKQLFCCSKCQYRGGRRGK